MLLARYLFAEKVAPALTRGRGLKHPHDLLRGRLPQLRPRSRVGED